MGLPDAHFLLPRFWVALALSLPVLVLAMGEMVAPSWWHRLDPRLSGWLQFALTHPGVLLERPRPLSVGGGSRCGTAIPTCSR